MSSPCGRQDAAVVVNHESLRRALTWLLAPSIFAVFRCGANIRWKPRVLAFAAMLWVWGDEATLKKRFVTARKLVVKMFRRRSNPGGTYQGFIKALARWSLRLFEVILPRFRQVMRECAGPFWTVAGWVVFAVDGSRVEVPRTKANEARFHPTKKRKPKRRSRKGKAPRLTRGARREAKRKAKARRASKKPSGKRCEKQSAGPQIWLTLLWHVGLGLPWAWKAGPVDSSERAHLLEMLGLLPKNSLIVADPGFVGYDNWRAIADAGHAFVIRVGSNVKLLKKLGYAREYDNRVYLWPDKARKQKQPPLVLRLIEVHTGKHPMYLVTNVLSQKDLSGRQAAEIYKARWGIEVFFRSFKQTFGRRKLRSDSPNNALLELDWSLLGLWAVCLLTVDQLIKQGEPPHRLSTAGALDAIRTVMRYYKWRPDPGEDLWALLGEALTDQYVRRSSKASRNYPRKKNEKPAGKPLIRVAHREQVKHAEELKALQQGNQLPA
ncbi:MAG: transposase [Pirellulales bacterium]